MIDSVLLIRPFAAEKKEFPLGLLYVGTALKQKGVGVQIIDLQDQPERENEIVEILKSSPNTMLGISAIAPHYKWVKEFTLRLKKEVPNLPIIVGGHIAICRQVLLQNSGVDYVCVGEGEEMLPDLIEALNSGRPLADVTGMAFKDKQGNVVKTGFRPQLKEFAIPDYELIDIYRYLIHPNEDAFFRQSPEYAKRATPQDNLGVIMFSRGCIGHCSFCYRHHAGYRQMSVEKSWEHVMHLYNQYGVRYFRIDDELFTNNTEWLREFCQKVKDSKLGILFRITGLRVDTIDDERLALLKESGCVGVNYGIESCSQSILDAMLKRVKVEQNVTAIKKTLEHGLATMAYIIWGYMDEDKKTVMETIDALLDLNLPPDLVSIFYLVALPGTTVYAHALRLKRITNEDAYLDSLYVLMQSREGIHKKYLINFSKLTEAQLRKYEEMFFFILKLQHRLGKKSGLVKILKAILEKTPSWLLLPLVHSTQWSVFQVKSLFNPQSNFRNSARRRLSIYKFKFLKNKLTPKSTSSYDDRESLILTLGWIKRAQDASYPGISRGNSLVWDSKFKSLGWQPPYPETTGYTIPTLFQAARLLNDPDLAKRAKDAADWELEIMLPNGSIRGGSITARRQYPSIFDTGQVIRGLIAAYTETREEKYLQAAVKSAEWIIKNESRGQGVWSSNHAQSVSAASTTYMIFAIAPIVELAKICGRQDFMDSAKRAAEHTISQQRQNGWFDQADFTPREDVLLHPLAYTIDGLWDIGLALNDERFLQAARNSMDHLLSCMNADGSIPGRLWPDWTKATDWICLTGMSQIGLTCLKIFQRSGDNNYYTAAMKAKNYISLHQNHTDKNLGGGLGAIWGSWPLDGGYQQYQSINWAAKFQADLLIQSLGMNY